MSIKSLFERLPDADREEFWRALSEAISFRGWDRSRTAMHAPCGCHACAFIKKVDEIATRNGTKFEEFT